MGEPTIDSRPQGCEPAIVQTEEGSALGYRCVLDATLQSGLRHGLRCLGSKEEMRQFGEWLSAEHPSHAEKIKNVVDCYLQKKSVGQCLSDVLSGSSSTSVIPDNPSVMCPFPPALALDRKQSPFNGINYFNHFRKRLDDLEIPLLEMRGFSQLAHFHYSQLSPSWPQLVNASIRSDPTYAERVAQYDGRATGVYSLNPPVCPKNDQWLRKEIEIPGVTYKVPIFTPLSSQIPAWIFHERVKAGFEMLKPFLTPTDLEQILHPGKGVSDMAFFVGGLFDQEREKAKKVFHACGLETKDKGGEFSPRQNHITLTALGVEGALVLGQGYPDERDPLEVYEKISGDHIFETFIHEIGHAIYFRLLDEDARRQIKKLYRLSHRRYFGEKNEVAFASNYMSVTLVGTDCYGMKNEWEFFAEWFYEYVNMRLMRGQHKGPLKARCQIMSEFFSPNGVNPAAFSTANMERIFREVGSKIDVEPTLKGVSFTVPRIGFQYSDGDFGTGPAEGWGLVAGLQLGYVSWGMPTGSIWGVGGLFDFSPGFNGELKDQKFFDAGLWGRFGYNTGPVGLFLEPGLGLRHADLEENNDTFFWLGGQAGLGFFGGGLSLFGQTRISPTNWKSFGGGVSLDFASIIRYGNSQW